MVSLCLVIALSTTLLLHNVTAVSDGCSPLPLSHFQWLNPDGSLVKPSYYSEIISKDEEDYGCCGPSCNGTWRLVPKTTCKFCSYNTALVCQGSGIDNVPSPASLPSTKLSLYKISGVGLVSLPPKSFTGLSIQNLVIANTNLSYLAMETFSGVKSIVSLYLKNNMLNYIPQAEYLFRNINGLKVLSLENNRLKVLSSSGTANLHNLTYFSLAGNQLYTMDVFFLQGSGLTFLDLRNVTFKLKIMEIKGSGLSKLPSSLDAIDLSRATITNKAIEKFMEQLKEKSIITLSLSYLQTQFFSFSALKYIKNSLKYLSLKGTDLSYAFQSRTKEPHISKYVKYSKVKELNLENCNISSLESGVISFPNISILSLAGNLLLTLDLTLFSYLPRLTYLDLSNTIITDVAPYDIDEEVINLQGADLSNTFIELIEDKSKNFFAPLKNLQMLSLCQSALSYEVAFSTFNLNSLKYLDLSAAISSPELGTIFSDLCFKNNKSLTELHLAQNNFKSTSDYFSNFSQLTSLENLDLSNNLIRDLSDVMFPSTLKTLNTSQNLITTWYFPILNNESQLQYLDISNNQLTYVSEAMIEDFYKLHYLGLDSNPLICHNKVVALVCSNIKNNTQNFNNETQCMRSDNKDNSGQKRPEPDITNKNSSTLTLIGWKQYKCYDIHFSGFRQFSQESDCNEYYEEESTTHNPTTQSDDHKSTIPIQPHARKLAWNWEWTYFIVAPILMVSALGGIVYLKWWNIRCFFHHYISLKKVRLLRKNGNSVSKPEIYYDVFVSYSDVDRAWILDHLVPNMERDGDVSLCFHERDFQVGMSILENIIDCMDRSHALLLVVSSAFIYSKWCQFEMHLAQNRLIETFRDQLVLVLLEDIPRRARPQTLHHLMMTKTYLMWPQQPCKDDIHELFWRRLKRALKPNPNYTLPASCKV